MKSQMSVTVPANAGRLFRDRLTALSQPTVKIVLGDSNNSGIVSVLNHDKELIRYDENYCTSNLGHLKESQKLIEIFAKFRNGSHLFIDIGAGQGEYVDSLTELGFNSLGYDPVHRSNLEKVFPAYFQPTFLKQFSARKIVVTMRCVLPHIVNPIQFLNDLYFNKPVDCELYVYLEYQALEWTIRNSVWQQISHDHVNQFSLDDFADRYAILESGRFLNGEWQFVLFKLDKSIDGTFDKSEKFTQIKELILKREEQIQKLHLLVSKNSDSKIAIFSAAGKGTIAAHALVTKRDKVIAIDNDLNRQGKFLESSGVYVCNYSESLRQLNSKSLIWCLSPNHLSYVNGKFADSFNVVTFFPL